MGDGIPPSPEGNVVAGPSGSQPLQEIQITLSLFARLIRVFNKGYKRFGKDVVGNVAERVNLLAQNAMKLSTLDRQEPSTSDRQELMNKLLRMVDDLREREKTATPDEKANIVQARTFAYMKIWEIYGTTQLGKLSQQDREVRQETYGAALGEWILSKATSKQEVIDLFVFQAIELQKANKESAPIIIGAMLKDIGRKYPDGVNDLSKIWDLVSSGTGSTQEAHESFVEKAIESPKLALIVLDQIRKTNPEALEKLRPAILRGRWELGKVFFGIRDIVTQGRTDQQSIAQLNTLWTSSSLQLRAIFKEAIQQLMKPVVEAKVKDLTARFREDRIDQEVTNGLSGIVELNSKISCLDKESVQKLMNTMLECCGRQYGKFPLQPSMEFVYKNCDAIAKTIRLGETVLGEQESHKIFERNPGLKTWLQSHEMLRRGTLEKFSAPAPPVDILLEGKREEARSKCPEGTKKLVSDWFPHFLCPKEAVDDLQRSQACFTTAKGEKIEIAALGRESKDINEVACQFAQAIYDSFPHDQQTPELKDAIGKLFIAISQGFAPASVCTMWINQMSLATGRFYAFQQLSASEVPMLRQSASFTINPQTGSLTGEYRLVGYLVDMSKKREDDDYNVSQLLTLSSKVEVPRAGGDITFTFQSLSRLTDSITEEMLVNKWVHLPLMGGVNPIETEDQLKDLLERCELVFLDLQQRGCDSPDSVLHEQFENVESNLKMLQKAYLAKVETFPLQQVSDVTAIDDQDLTRPYEDCSFNTLFLLKACRNMDAKEAREALKKKMTALRTDLKAKLVKETPDKKEELRNWIFNLEQNMTYALIEIPVE